MKELKFKSLTETFTGLTSIFILYTWCQKSHENHFNGMNWFKPGGATQCMCKETTVNST